MRRSPVGFTLIELLVVIVLVGILAATALPRYVNLQQEARAAVVQNFSGALTSAVSMVHTAWAARGSVSPVTMADGTLVAVTALGYPTANFAGIGVAMNCESPTGCQGMATVYGFAVTFRPDAGSAFCQVFYGSDGTVGAATTGC